MVTPHPHHDHEEPGYPLHGAAISKLYREGTYYIMRRWDIPPLSLFWGWGSWGSEQLLGQRGERSTASSNITLWTRYKAKGAPRDPEYVTLLEEWALYLLKVGVGLA